MSKQDDAQETEQTALLNIDTELINAYWVDLAQPLKVPLNALHYKAHKLQILLAILDKQAGKNPAQFNSRNYIDALNEYTDCIRLIKDGSDDTKTMANVPSSETQTVGERDTFSLDTRVSTDNPTSG